MPDWQRRVRERLGTLDLPPSQRDEVAAELAGHLEEVYDESRALGMAETQAAELAWNEVCDWNRLNRQIRRSKCQEGSMNDRTRHLWLPGLASFVAAVICEVALARWSYRPEMLFRSHVTQLMYGFWLVAQLGCGAVGAYLSRRAGGTRSARVVAALFTSTIFLIAMLGVVGTSLFARATGLWRQDFGSIDLLMIARAIGIVIVIPSFAMLAGALPFLSDRKQTAAA